MKRALILAAGKGKRLGELTAKRPKCLLQLTENRTILDFLLEAIKKVGTSEIVIVSGFEDNILKEHLSNNWASEFVFKIIHNPKFEECNNIYSAYLAKDLWDDNTILFNSDIIFDPEILKNLISKLNPKSSQSPIFNPQSYLVIDDTKELADEDMKVIVNEKNEIQRVHKSLDSKNSFGEYIGITYLRGEERVKFLESVENNVKNKNFGLYYEDALDQIAKTISVFPSSTEKKLWAEVDTQEDLEIAKCIIRKLEDRIRL